MFHQGTCLAFPSPGVKYTRSMDDPHPIRGIADYAQVDPAIRQWCKSHSLTLGTNYKDCDVRSVDVVGPSGKKCQVWIDAPENGTVMIHVWPYAAPHERLTVHVEDIGSALERAYDLAAQFIA